MPTKPAKPPVHKSGKNKFSFTAPSKAFVKNFMRPFKLYFSPVFYGLDELDVNKPALYVSNHTILGVLDGYPFGTELYLQKGLMLRSLVDNNHYLIPVWRDVITNLGAVRASRENCSALMKMGESILVFPGGTREVCKKKGEAYILKWSDRTGFVRMAIEHGYDIIPVAAVGAEEAFEIVQDGNEFLKTPFGKFLKLIGVAEKYLKNGDLVPPIIKGYGNTIFPKPVKLYFKFGKRISTTRYKSKHEDPKTLNTIKGKVEKALLSQFKELYDIRDNDKDVGFIRKYLLSEGKK
jgi:1-acyl-sn-glycerol-3-phosphate acyltransferase